jgi:hypothetical protein
MRFQLVDPAARMIGVQDKSIGKLSPEFTGEIYHHPDPAVLPKPVHQATDDGSELFAVHDMLT